MELNYGYNTPQDQQWNVYPAPSGSSEMLEPQEGLFPDLNPDDFAPPTDGHMQGDFMFETSAENDMANLNTTSLKMLLAPPHPHLNPSGSELTELREQSGQPYLVQDDLTRQRQMDMQGRVRVHPPSFMMHTHIFIRLHPSIMLYVWTVAPLFQLTF